MGTLPKIMSVHRLYIPRSDGERGLVSVKDCVEEEKCNLSKDMFIKKGKFLKIL